VLVVSTKTNFRNITTRSKTASPASPTRRSRTVIELKANRDQARADTKRATNAVERLGPSITLKAFVKQARKRMRIQSGGLSPRPPVRTRPAQGGCEGSSGRGGRKACSCARSPPHPAQKRQGLSRQGLECPVFGNGAPGTIRTSDPQIRSLMLYPAELRARFSRDHVGQNPPTGMPTRFGRAAKERSSYRLPPDLARYLAGCLAGDLARSGSRLLPRGLGAR
jgi:hypothetical protein